MDRGLELVERDHEHLIHSLHNPAVHRAGVVWASAEGIYLRDAAGRSFIDGMSGLWNVTLGCFSARHPQTPLVFTLAAKKLPQEFAAVSLATLQGCRRPVDKIVPYSRMPEDVAAAVCLDCKGVGVPCSNNAECCTTYCDDNGTCALLP